jgi:hypothetical protein
MNPSERYKAYQLVHQNFLSLFRSKEFFNDLDLEQKKLSGDLLNISSGFRSNLNSVISILEIPIIISASRTKLLIYDKFLTQELILNAPMPDLGIYTKDEKDEMDKENRAKTFKTAEIKFFEFLNSEKGGHEFWHTTFKFLQECINSNMDLQMSASQLLRQGIVLLWTTFEVLARDFTIYFLNNHPNFFRDFGLKSLPTELLEKYEFRIDDKLGEIYAEMHDWSNLNVIIRTFKILQSDNNDLMILFNDYNLWKLNQRRHLIVHRSSIIDKKYLESTADKYEIGETLNIEPNEFINDLMLIKNIGVKILNVKI